MVYGTINGALTLVPIYPYVGAAGFLPLSVVFSAIGPLVLGPMGGVLAGTIGGVIGVFINPVTFPLGPIDAVLTGMLPALYVSLIVNSDDNKYWILSILAIVISAAIDIFFPYIWPGVADQSWTIDFLFLGLLYWLPWLIISVTPIGKSKIPEWARADDSKHRYIGVALVLLSSLYVWWIPWAQIYWFVGSYTLTKAYNAYLSYTLLIPLLAAVSTVLAVALVESLVRSGLPKIPRAIW